MCTVKNNLETIVFPLTLKQNKILKQFQQIWTPWEAILLWYDFYENQRRLIFCRSERVLINLAPTYCGPKFYLDFLAIWCFRRHDTGTLLQPLLWVHRRPSRWGNTVQPWVNCLFLVKNHIFIHYKSIFLRNYQR